jgi:integrase
MRRGIRLRYLNRSGEWPSGNPRLYFRRPGGKNVPMPDLPQDDPGFLKAYADAMEQAKAAPQAHPKGSLGAALTDYLASPALSRLSPATRARRRRQAEDMRKRYGSAMLRGLLPRHIRKDLSELSGHAANDRLKTWRGFCKWAVRTGRVDTDPAREVEKPDLPQSDGFTPWTQADVEAFRAHWKIGTPQRLAFELLYRTCAAIGDACKLTRGHVEDGWLVYARGKTDQIAVVPWAPENRPEWFGEDDLDACLRGHAHMSFIVTAFGKPRSQKAATQWFSEACTAAGLPNLSAHGVRKYRAAMFKEAGADQEKRMAILGHATEAEASRYSKSADLRRVISGTKTSNPISQLRPTRKKGA